MADFWGMLGKSIPKKGYSKYGKSIDRKVRRVAKSAARKRKASGRIKAQKVRQESKPKPEPKWHPVRTYQSKSQALAAAESLRKSKGCPTRVDGTARGYQVWIKS